MTTSSTNRRKRADSTANDLKRSARPRRSSASECSSDRKRDLREGRDMMRPALACDCRAGGAGCSSPDGPAMVHGSPGRRRVAGDKAPSSAPGRGEGFRGDRASDVSAQWGDVVPSRVAEIRLCAAVVENRVSDATRDPSRRAAAVAQCFGLSTGGARSVLPDLTVRVGPGRILAFVGPSGSGKTTALQALAHRFPNACAVNQVCFPEGRALVDAVAPDASLADALELLSRSALGEAALWLQPFESLSAGEQFRARLARAWGTAARGGMLLIDEFGSGLHVRAARAIAYNLRRLATRRGLCLALATCREDVITDLQPDTLIRLRGGGAGAAAERPVRNRPLDLWRRVRISRGVRRDYDDFAHMHYRTTDELGFVDKIFLLHETARYSPVGIVVYCHPPAELALRNQATGGRYKRNLKRLNAEVRILRRLILHPDLRGCGVAHRFVARTLRLLDVRYVECLAAMGTVNPVFERAGMTRIGQCALPPDQQRIIDELARLDVKVHAADFEVQVCRRPIVRELVAQLVYNWYRATTCNGEARVARQSPRLLARLCRGLVGVRPVYYLWENPQADQNDRAADFLRTLGL